MKTVSKLGMGLSIASMLALTACGAVGTQSGSGSTNASAGGNSKTILIGVETPTTGSSAQMGEDMNNAIKMAADEINAKGGIGGKQIQLVYADDAADPQTAATAANKLVSEGVVAVVGGYASGAVLPASGIYHQAGIPMVVTAANSSKIPAQGYNDIFLINGTTIAQAQTAADYMTKKIKAKRIAIIDDNSAYAVDLADETKQSVTANGGQVVTVDAIDPNQSDFSTELTHLKSLNPDATYWTGYYAAGGLLLKQFRQLGVSGAFGVGDGSNDSTLAKIAGTSNVENVFTTTSPTPDFQPSAKAWVTQYQSQFKTEPGPYSALSYDGMRVLADAISRAGSTDKGAIIKALSETKGFETFGGPISFKSDGELAKSNFIVLVFKNGKYVLPNQ